MAACMIRPPRRAHRSAAGGLVVLAAAAGLSLPAGGLGAAGAAKPAPDAGAAKVERIGPPTFYMQDLARYGRYRQRPPQRYQPIPRTPVSRQTYYQWLIDSGHFAYAVQAERHGQYGPRHFMPVLARYVKTGERRWGLACITMLKAFGNWLREEVARKGWHSLFIDEPGYVGLYRRYLSRGGLLDETKDAWMRELVLYMARHLHVWGTKPTFWRGPMHRAQGEGVMKGLAATWYGDAPEAPAWRTYARCVYQDWWRFKDHPPNDTGYYFGILMPLVLRAELLGDDAMFTEAAMKGVWERMMYEVSPDGSVLPYGAHGGWNATAGTRIFMLELAAAKTKDGRFRFVAHRLMNYLLYQQQAYKKHHILLGPETTEKLAAAWLVADDAVRPVPPKPASRIVYRKETLRLRNHRSKKMAGRFLKDLDPAPDRAHVCCGLIVTDRTMPSKLILTSGRGPGDFFALVDLFPRHDPLNVPGILGMTRWGAALTTTISAKGESDENRLVVTDLTGKAPRRRNTDADLADPYYQEVAAPHLADLKKATFATVVVTGYAGLPITYTREFAFIKNRFLVARDAAEFHAGFRARASSVFNTQNVGPQVGGHWANTFMSEPMASTSPLRNPPVDLLVYFAPRPDCRLQIVDRTAADPRTADVPAQLRYTWQGQARPGQKLLFTQVYYPHPPAARLCVSNAAGDPRNEGLLGSAGADGIETLTDTVARTILRFRLADGRTEWVVCNPAGSRAAAGDLATDARFAYVDVTGGKVAGVAAVDATFLSLAGKDVFRRPTRGTVER